MEQLRTKMEDETLQKLLTPVVKMELPQIEEELNETLAEHEIWDRTKVKQDPADEITIHENTMQLPKEIAQCSLADMLNNSHEVFQSDVEGVQSAVTDNMEAIDAEVQDLSLKKSLSLVEHSISGKTQNLRDSVKNRVTKRKMSNFALAGNQPSLQSINLLNSQSHFMNSNTREKSFRYATGKPHTCDICHKCFSQPSHLKSHVRTHTGNKPYICDSCNKCFNEISNFKRHIRIHLGNKPYTCDTCHKCFGQQSHLKSHIRIHTGSKPYSCDTCHKCFSEISNFKRHIRIHSGNKPYTCDTCQKCFSQLCHLKSHLRMHSGNKPYTCDICNKSFSQVSHLKSHSRIHTGSKPFSCDICHKSFTHLSTLKRHSQIHVREKKYAADACNKWFC